MMCACGAFIRRPAVRCKKCAIEFVRGIDTDRFDRVVDEVEKIMLSDEPTGTEPNKPQKMSLAEARKEWRDFQEGLRTQRFLRKAAAIGMIITIIVVAIVLALIFRK
jgi:tetrahydromethanopterin S-methyltransferase subunit F